MPHPLLVFLLLTNLVAFLAMGLDKWRARRGARRTPERTRVMGPDSFLWSE